MEMGFDIVVFVGKKKKKVELIETELSRRMKCGEDVSRRRLCNVLGNRVTNHNGVRTCGQISVRHHKVGAKSGIQPVELFYLN